MAYFLLGDKDEGIECVEVNVDFGYEEAVSKAILAEMKKGELDAFALYELQDDIKAAIEKTQTIQADVKQPEPQKQTSGKKRDLTQEEIIEIIRKYGLNIYYDSSGGLLGHDDVVYDGSNGEFYSRYREGVAIVRTIYFCSDILIWEENNAISYVFGVGRTAKTLKYSVLRNEWTDEQVQQTFKDFPYKIITMLLELKNLE